jgi:hypothetical protein
LIGYFERISSQRGATWFCSDSLSCRSAASGDFPMQERSTERIARTNLRPIQHERAKGDRG